MEPPQETWRAVDPVLPGPGRVTAHEPPGLPDTRTMAVVLGIVAVVIAAIVVVLMLSAPRGEALIGADGAARPDVALAPMAATGSSGANAGTGLWLIDVEGAVRAPGLYRLAPGSRVGDAVSAAGGYSPRVDVAAMSAALNLAEELRDGAKIVVPERGDESSSGSRASSGGGMAGASPTGNLVDLNRATSAELDTLPGIGPATAAKILDSRATQPFASVDELLSRKLVRSDIFEKLQGLVTVGG